jgi:hypothetical protein
MNPPDSISAIQPSRKIGRIVLAFSYNLINAACLILCFHLALIIRSDGPSGFGEFIIKLLILKLSIACFFAGIALSILQCRDNKLRFFYLFMSSLITMLLTFFAALGVIEACDDSKGYCRNWQIISVAPKQFIQALGHTQPPMFTTFRRFTNIDFCASHQALLSGSGLSSVGNFGFHASNGVLSVQVQPSALFFRVVSPRLAPRGLNLLHSCVGHRLTLRSRGTRRKRRVPYL